ncbi:MAG: hypothetical protein AAFU54_26435 [Chloroflexota bacterium]
MVDYPQPGTRMSAAEYRQLPETNAPMQLIDGEIIMAPAPKDVHQATIGEIYCL